MVRFPFARASAAILVAVAAGCSLVRDLDSLGNGVPADGGGDVDVVLPDGGSDAPMSAADADSASDATLDATDGDAGSTYASEVLADHPVAWFRFGDATATIAKNERSSGDGHFIGSTPTVGVPGLVAGDSNTAVRLEGSARITLPTIAGLFVGQAPFSIEAWIAVDDTDGPLPTQWILGREDVSNPRFGTSFLVDSAGVALERWVNQGASRVTGPSPRRAAPSHVVTTFDGTRIQVWVDDTPSGLGPSPQNIPDNAYLTVAGAQSSQSAGFFHGVIDELALYDYVLGDARIDAHYRAGKGP